MVGYAQLKEWLFKLEPEKAHHIAEWALKIGGEFPLLLEPLAKRACVVDERLMQEILGLKFYNPVGLAAGFDKNGTMVRGLTTLGFSHLELGTVTPRAQEGNPKPRLFRHIEEESLQNSMGFNNNGASALKERLGTLYPYAIPLGINLGKNKLTSQEDALSDYEKLLETLEDVADYFTFNLSSPNTPNLRDLQNEEFVTALFELTRRQTQKPVFLKISPDMETKEAVALCVKAVESGASGIIATNTTTDYTLVENPKPAGGLSGKVLQKKSYTLFREIAKELFGKSVLISVGGIDSGEEAYKRIRAGASLVQIYTSFIFRGPLVAQEINEEILFCLQRDGLDHISQAIGADLQ